MGKNLEDAMTKTTKDLRAKAEQAIAALHAASDAERAANARVIPLRHAGVSRRTFEAVLAENVADQERLRAEQATSLAEVMASIAVDAAEAAEGDALAIACDVNCLHADLSAILAEEDSVRAQLREIEAKRDARISEAQKAHEDLTKRRATANLPAPAAMPRARDRRIGEMTFGPSDVARSLVDALGRRIAGELPPVKSNAERLERLGREERNLRIEIELAHREREKQEEAARKGAAWRDAEARASAEREQKRRADEQASIRQKHEEREALVAAQRAREANLGTPPTTTPEETKAGSL